MVAGIARRGKSDPLLTADRTRCPDLHREGGMRRKAFDLILLLAILVGGIQAWTSGRERAKLSKEYARLARTAGDPAIGDPAKVHLVALETGDPLHFAWRVYYPANYQEVLASIHSGSHVVRSSLSTSDPTEAILRLRFRENDRGIVEIYMKGMQGRFRSPLGDESLADLLRGRRGEIDVEQIGAEDVAVIGPDEQVSLIKLTLPGAMQAEADQKLSEWARKNCTPILYELKLGAARP
jgi:hypothetical protein